MNSQENNLIELIRRGDDDAWQHVINLYEGRLRAFALSRLNDNAKAEDVVQETFIGFLTSLPNYDPEQSSLETYLFRIAGFKIVDHLRREGRRPVSSMNAANESPAGRARKASSMARSREGSGLRKQYLQQTLEGLIDEWVESENYERLMCCELLFVRGWGNKQVAETLEISEQKVANHKQFVIKKLQPT